MKRLFVFFLLITLSFNACKKEQMGIEPAPQASNSAEPRNSDVENFGEHDSVAVPTVLGPARVNPYTVSNFNAAYQELYGTQGTLTATHRYIKWKPSSPEQIVYLDSLGFNVYDYPLERAVISMGDYNPDAILTPAGLPELYSVIKVNQTLPAQIPSETLADLHLNSADEALIRKAISRTGADPEVVSYKVAPFEGDSGGGGNPTKLNDCGCEVYSSIRMPGGCVRVAETGKKKYEGVRKVKIIVKDDWFSEDETNTDDLGCWKVNAFYENHLWLWVKFDTDRCQIRGARAGAAGIVEWINPVKDYVGKKSGPVFNNQKTTYEVWTGHGTSEHIHWAAATVNNALEEYHDFANEEGMGTPPYLDIYIGRNHRYGYTIMDTQYDMAFVAGFMGSYLWTPFIGLPLLGGIAVYLPDVYIGADYNDSRLLKSLTYHELTHAAHRSVVTHGYWLQLAIAEIRANGHGHANSPGAPLISLCEGWASHMEYYFQAKNYPNNQFWLNQIEDLRNETENHIPIGVYYDLVDSNQGSPFEFVCDEDNPSRCGTITDRVNGFTNAELFSKLNTNITSVDAFQQAISVGQPSNAVTNIQILFDSY
jgi:hypothetical protein